MNELNLFPTKVYTMDCNLNLEQIKGQIYNHARSVESTILSNVGGYQGHEFENKDLWNLIAQSIPQVSEKPLKEITGNMWVNINGNGDYNEIHNHNPFLGTALSGVFYVQTPPNSGRIRFYDPRKHYCNAADMLYYNNGYTFHYIDPRPNLLIIFPGWLDHMVETNNSNEDRISISFNIKFEY